MYRGYVKTWRRLLDSDLFKNPKLSHFFQWCLLKASHKAHTIIIGYQTVDLLPGQFVMGRVRAALETGLSEKSCRTCVAQLNRQKRIKTASNRASSFTLVTVCNWELYQSNNSDEGQQNGHERASEGPVKGQPAATYKNVMNGKGGAASPPASKKKPEKKRPKRKPMASDPESVQGDGAGGRLVKLWIDRFTGRTGQKFSESGKGKLAGIVKNLLTGFSADALSTYVVRWFAADRKGYGVELFKMKLEGGDAELMGRGSESYDGDDELGRRNLAKLRTQLTADHRNGGAA